MKSMPTLSEDISKAVDVLRHGGVIAYPTDTVWGLGCDASCQDAVRRIYEIKQRVDSKALITLVSDRAMLEEYIEGEIPSGVLEELASCGRPVTVVYPRGRNVARALMAADGSLGIRVVAEGFANALCRAFGGAIVSTSANISGLATPALYSEIAPEILAAVDYVAAHGREGMAPARPSKVVRLCPDGCVETLRD